ncbi:MAG: hypothetical protein ACLT98_00910 [Eggerthellaceae bacterium]
MPAAAGFERENAYLTFQEYFERLRNEAQRWGKPGRSSCVEGSRTWRRRHRRQRLMSGSFETLDVPPPVSFATAVGHASRHLLNSRKPQTRRAD